MFDTFSAIARPRGIRVALPALASPWQSLAYQALDSLLREFFNGFEQTQHVMPFPRQKFQVEEDWQRGDVFQRALILDTFLDFNSYLSQQLQEVIAAEVQYLVSTRRNRGIGGWAYFPNLPELPPDADDLAQIMQVLLRAGYAEVLAPFIEVPLQVLLNDQANEDAWESWIIPKQMSNEEQVLQQEWVDKAWGTGSDVEVVANLVYALQLYDASRFQAEINRGLAFLYNNHQGRFCWKSTWYHGDYYGTYVSLRAICAASGNKIVVEAAIRFLEEKRNRDGSWSIKEQGSSPLQTALALLALAIAKQYLGQQLSADWLEPSLQYLQANYTPQQGWPASPFIQMPMGRPYGFVHTILSYESASITNNYIAKTCHFIHQHHLL